jgi:hypothetical protein
MELALCDPEPLAVATWMLKSLTIGVRSADVAEPLGAISVVAINTPDSVAPRNMHDGVGSAIIIGQPDGHGNSSDGRVGTGMVRKAGRHCNAGG